MKNMKWILIAVICLTLTVGCTPLMGVQDTTPAENVAEKKTEVDTVGEPLKTDEEEKKPVAEVQENIVSEPPVETVADKGVQDYELSAWQDKVDALIEEAENLQPDSDKEKKREQYRDMERRLEQLEEELDHAEDQAERDCRDGLLSREDYREVERELESMEDQLDRAEEGLEYRFDYDD